jgi:hypothetical protein
MRTLLLVPLLTACAGSSPTPAVATSEPETSCPGPLAGEPLRSRPGERACTDACIDAHARRCDAGATVWRIELNPKMAAMFGTLHVSSTGFARIELPGRNLYGIDGHVWLDCYPGCDACVPVPWSFVLRTLKGLADCEFSAVPAEPWQDHRSETVHTSCRGISFDLRLVPDLVALRDALLTANLLDARDDTSDLDGLVVGVGMSDVEFETYAAITEETCDALDLPSGAETRASVDDYEAMSELWRTVPVGDDGDVEAYMRRHEDALCEHFVGH